MTSATEILRRLLDERGVEWEDMSALGFLATLWHGEDAACTALEGADDIPHGKVSVQACLTPEQAVEATLWRGTCEDVGKGWMWRCSECKCRLDIDRDDLPTMWVDNVASVPRYCPNCGKRVVE